MKNKKIKKILGPCFALLSSFVVAFSSTVLVSANTNPFNETVINTKQKEIKNIQLKEDSLFNKIFNTDKFDGVNNLSYSVISKNFGLAESSEFIEKINNLDISQKIEINTVMTDLYNEINLSDLSNIEELINKHTEKYRSKFSKSKLNEIKENINSYSSIPLNDNKKTFKLYYDEDSSEFGNSNDFYKNLNFDYLLSLEQKNLWNTENNNSLFTYQRDIGFDEIDKKNNNHNYYYYRNSRTEQEKQRIDNIVSNLKRANVVLTAVTVASALATVAYWAAAWWFGLTIPAAIASTVLSASLGAVSGAISLALTSYEKNYSWYTVPSSLVAGTDIGLVFYRVLYAVLVSATATATATSWAVPAALSLLPIFSLIIASVSYWG